MSVLGVGGRLVLQRETPLPIAFSPKALHLVSNGLNSTDQTYWSGDRVIVQGPAGLPFLDDNNVPQCPDGFGSYCGSKWYLGENRQHIASDGSKFYNTDDDVDFYANGKTLTEWSGYIHRDQLNRFSFYDTRAAALNGAKADRAKLGRVNWAALMLYPAAAGPEYQNAAAACAGDIGEYLFSDARSETTLKSICDYAPTFDKPVAGTTEYDNADIEPRAELLGVIWQTVCDVQEWSLDLTADSLDTTVVGEKFGEAVKSIVTGGGKIDFLVDRRETGEGQMNGSALMQLLLMNEKGCKASAQFWLINDREESPGLLAGDLYYETEMLVTGMALNLRPTELIAGSATFVTTGQIKLKEGAS